MEKFRIVTNGLVYTVEKYENVGFWKEQMAWVKDREYLGGGLSYTITFDTLEEAQARIKLLKDEWTVVEENGELHQ